MTLGIIAKGILLMGLILAVGFAVLKAHSKTVRIDVPHACGGCEGDCQCH